MFLLILVFFVVISNFIWLKIDNLPPQGGALNHLFPAINFYLDIIHTKITFPDILTLFKSLSSIKTLFFNIVNYIRFVFSTYPPLVPFSYTIFYLLFGPHTKMELMVNSLYLAIALLSIYGMGKKILNEKAGLLAAFIFSSFPGVIILTRCAYAEFFLMCLIALTLYLLLKTDFLQNRKYSILLGISLGLTALSKWDFPLALIGPFAVTLWIVHGFDKSKENRENHLSIRTTWKNLFIAILIATLISIFWYFSCLNSLLDRMARLKAESINFTLWLSPSKFISQVQILTYFLFATINAHIGFFYFVILLLTTVIFATKIIGDRSWVSAPRKKLFIICFLTSWLVIPYVAFTLTKIFFPPHIALILPALAVLIGLGVYSIKNSFVRISFISIVILYGLIIHLTSFFISGHLNLLST